ncbi:hairy-related 3 [Xiphias gladius]|uniref:hairy-related 3 n=1 Tax=Xiphias gladius TaxID=8245 RepID=UPI001A9907A4|nr:hairy-related 3 [Xiphias gladius]
MDFPSLRSFQGAVWKIGRRGTEDKGRPAILLGASARLKRTKRMVATTDCAEKSKPIAGHKVSKPLMEKKRRARINKCLDQLKSLLESYYSSNIRKRKLEKADILELTVKHLRNLQKIQSCSTAASELSDYQSGFRSCLANVNQYLVAADTLNGGDRWMLSQLSSKLCRSLGRGGASSTMDSGPGQAEVQDEAPRLLPSAAGPEEGRAQHRSKAQKRHGASTPRSLPSEDARQSPGSTRAVLAAAPAPNSREKGAGHEKCHSVRHRNEAASTQLSVWRPW